MPKHEALKALHIYRRAGQQAGNMSDFYESCRGLDLAGNFQFPTLREPPQTFLSTMEEYVKEAPRMMPVIEPLSGAAAGVRRRNHRRAPVPASPVRTCLAPQLPG